MQEGPQKIKADVQTVGKPIIGKRCVQQEERFVTDVKSEDILLLSATQNNYTK